MYSLVIAEDELTTRRGLVHMVKWNEIGFQVNAEFSDGQELLAYLKTSMPDVILTDIKMSRVSGLDIARFAAEQNLPVQIVFLSGYKDFEYAQSAVEYHVTSLSGKTCFDSEAERGLYRGKRTVRSAECTSKCDAEPCRSLPEAG